MMTLPETRISLLVRLQDQQDAAAWIEFCSIYEKAIYNIARRRGLQDADALEVSQEVLWSISRQVENFDPSKQGKFRAWLARIARNATIDMLRRNTVRGRNQTNVVDAGQLDLRQSQDSELFELEGRREQFRWAAAKVRQQVSLTSWQAFWETSVKQRPCEHVAQELGMSIGALYVARSRVLAKIKRIVQPFREADK
ncbi:MAG TPA: sigma-70 family RNA polymerase sigma factor [Planctomycetaceae bacterium]|nr:sigma-70 family RNA polymerase sigma factor [Planctomycetaceae bacterium]